MPIARTIEWQLTCSPEEADSRFRRALEALDMSPQGPPGQVHGKSKRAIMKNRWSADVSVTITPGGGEGSHVRCRVEMPGGTKHFEVADEVAAGVGEEVFDDRGLPQAVERLGKPGRFFGRKEVRHLRNLLRFDERVAELGQGQYGGKQGLVVLTNQRLFFFEKSLGSETVEEFALSSISSFSVGKKMTGETLQIHASGNNAEIKSMGHGQGDAVASAFRELKSAGTQAQPQIPNGGGNDPLVQLERLSSLRDKGIVSAEEFELKKAELLNRM